MSEWNLKSIRMIGMSLIFQAIVVEKVWLRLIETEERI
jgi:hypothetical protein